MKEDGKRAEYNRKIEITVISFSLPFPDLIYLISSKTSVMFCQLLAA